MKKVETVAEGKLAFAVRLVPRASRSEIVGWTDEGRLKIRITSPPVDEGANRELVKLLAKLLGVHKGDVVIASGAHSRTKRLVVPRECENRLLGFENI